MIYVTNQKSQSIRIEALE